jgi:hypothetical protein
MAGAHWLDGRFDSVWNPGLSRTASAGPCKCTVGGFARGKPGFNARPGCSIQKARRVPNESGQVSEVVIPEFGERAANGPNPAHGEAARIAELPKAPRSSTVGGRSCRQMHSPISAKQSHVSILSSSSYCGIGGWLEAKRSYESSSAIIAVSAKRIGSGR